jgi:RNA polymerase sigma factor (sigma-70 family)
MAATQAGVVLRHLRELVRADGTERLSDPELLERFTRGRDESAFTAVVKRHGPLVLGVCRRVLGNLADAEDAFQATFLVLAQKAAAIARHAALPCWLYQVAYRVALKAKTRAASRHRHEQRTAAREAADPLAEITGRELLGVLDEELQGLSERHRAPLVLCYLEGHTCDEAARQLGCSPRTLKRWLDQARRCLARRLGRRGLTLPAALLAGGLAAGPSRAAIPAKLAAETIAAGVRGVACPAVAAGAALAESILREAPASRLRAASLVLALAGMVAAGAAGLAGAVADSRPEAPPSGRPDTTALARSLPPLLPAAGPGDERPVSPKDGKAEDGTLTVSGRVLNAEGKPLAGAPVAVVGRSKDFGRGGDLLRDDFDVLAQGKTAADGRFRLAARRAASGWYRDLYVLARAPGCGIGLHPLSLAAPAAEVTLRLTSERVVRGRLVDLQGQPAAGVTVQVHGITRLRNGLPEGVHLGRAPRDLAAWPATVRTDAQGKFEVRGLSRTYNTSLFVEGERFAPQTLYVDLTAFLLPMGLNRSLAPAQVIEGRVLEAETGKPVPHALLTVYSGESEFGNSGGLGGKADAEGRFRLSPYAGKWFTVSARPPSGAPYMSVEKRFKWETGKVRRQLDLKLPRGVLVRGKVTEAGSGKPVARAAVQYYPLQAKNPNFKEDIVHGWQGIEVSKGDGTFQIAVLPGPGHLLIMGQNGQYIHEEIGSTVLYSDRPGGRRFYADAIVRLDLPKEDRVKDMAVTLKRGVTVKGRLLGPDGQPVGKALMICRLNVDALSPMWHLPVRLRDGQFELPGLDPEKSCPVAFLDPENRWGATVQLSGKQAKGPLTVKLRPCGQAKARFLDKTGRPLANHRPMIDIVVTPGAHRYDYKAAEKGQLAADGDFLSNVDRHNYWRGPVTGADGRCTFPALIPGVTYHLTSFGKDGHYVAREFTAESGKTFDAGDITFPRN